MDSTLFFVGLGKKPNQARAICETCVVQPDCLAYSFETEQEFGVWGGVTEKERRDVLRQHRRVA